MTARVCGTCSRAGCPRAGLVETCEHWSNTDEETDRSMQSIWKFEVHVKSNSTISMPVGAKVLSVQTQFDRPFIWAICDTDAPVDDRHFVVVGTGHNRESFDGLRYIGTFQLNGGNLVFHLFEQE